MQNSHPLRALHVASWDLTIQGSLDRALYVRSKTLLGRYPAKLTNRLDHWAKCEPDRTFLAERAADHRWRRISYSEFRAQARRVAQSLLNLNLSAERPIAILSGNDIEHALLGMAAMYAGIPYAPISPAYSLVSPDLARLRRIFELLTPGLVYASDGLVFEHAIRELTPAVAHVVVGKNPPPGRETEIFSRFLATAETSEVDRADRATSQGSVAKILFTSGSTGIPKGVITTHRMLSSNQEMLSTVFPFLAEEPPVVCDWLPWHHTFGGSHNFGLVLSSGGSLYIDQGRPMHGAFEESLRNLSEIAPTVYFNVPKGYELLVNHMTANPGFREHFFSRLRMTFFAAAGLPQAVWDAFDQLAVETIGARVPMLTGLGATETAPFALCAGKENRRSGVVGLPAPGLELKLVPVNGKREARVRGPNVTPGYWRQAELTCAAFDEEGFYCMGDALRFVDPSDPNQGFIFDGRLAEDFKLSTGTWVSVGPLRSRFILHGAPWVKDLAIAGHGRAEVTALIFPEPDEYVQLEADGGARMVFERLLRDFVRQSTGSSNRIARAIVLSDPPSLDAGELTDKGSINQAVVLERRAALVDRLYSMPWAEDVIVAL